MLGSWVLLERSPEGVAEAEPNSQGLLFGLLPQGSTEAIRLRACLDDVCLIGEPIEHGLTEPGVGEDLGPLREGHVGGHYYGGRLSPLGDYLEEQFGCAFGKRDIAELVDDDQLHTRPAGQHPAQALFPLRLDELVDQRSGSRKAHSLALTARSDSQAGGKMTLACAGVTNQQDGLGTFEIAALGQGADAGGGDVWRLSEIELFERLDPGQVRLLHPQLDAASFPIFHLRLEQSFEIVQMRVLALGGFFSERGELRPDGWQSPRLTVLSDTCDLEAHACTACNSRSYSIMVGSGRSYADSAPISIGSPTVCCN